MTFCGLIVYKEYSPIHEPHKVITKSSLCQLDVIFKVILGLLGSERSL